MATLTGTMAVLKEFRGCVIPKRRDATRGEQLIHTLLVERIVLEKGCLCKDERTAILKVIEETVLRDFHYSFNPSKQLCESIQCTKGLLAIYPF